MLGNEQSQPQSGSGTAPGRTGVGKYGRGVVGTALRLSYPLSSLSYPLLAYTPAQGSNDMLPLGDYCALQLHVPTGGGGQDVRGPVHHMRHTNHAVRPPRTQTHTGHCSCRPTHPTYIHSTLPIAGRRSGAEQKTLTHHAL